MGCTMERVIMKNFKNALGVTHKKVFFFGYEALVCKDMKYVAIDPDGEIWAYDHKPTLGHLRTWKSNGDGFELVGTVELDEHDDWTKLIVEV